MIGYIAGLSSFRVYRHKSVVVYREAITRRDCHSLLVVALMPLRAASAMVMRTHSNIRRQRLPREGFDKREREAEARRRRFDKRRCRKEF